MAAELGKESLLGSLTSADFVAKFIFSGSGYLLSVFPIVIDFRFCRISPTEAAEMLFCCIIWVKLLIKEGKST